MQDVLAWRVADAMTYRPPHVTPHTSLAVAQELLARPGIDCLPVADDGMLVGVVTGFDLQKAFALPEGTRSTAVVLTPVSCVMTDAPVTVRPDTPLERAVQLLLTTGHRSLPVTIGALLIGVLTGANALRLWRGAAAERAPA